VASFTDQPKSRGRPKGSKNRSGSTLTKPTGQTLPRSAVVSPASSREISKTSATKSHVGRKPGTKNKNREIAKVTYRTNDLVEASDGTVYQLDEHVYQKPTNKALIPLQVKCRKVELQPHEPGTWLSTARWRVCDGDLISLKTRLISHKRVDMRETAKPGEFIASSTGSTFQWGVFRSRKSVNCAEQEDQEDTADDEEQEIECSQSEGHDDEHDDNSR
jgi:hypothetical protein